MRRCIYIATLLALVNCELNQNISLRNRILGGEFVMDVEEYPFMVFLIRHYYVKGEGWIGTCGATILNTKYLLSAAHCFLKAKPNFKRHPANEYTEYVGGISVNRSLYHANIKKYFIHPKNEYYKHDKKHINNFDIAVIKLDKELHFSSKISSVKLPPPSTTSGLTSRLPKRCILLGFGITSLHLLYKYEIALLKVAGVEIVDPNNTTDSVCKEITKICSIDVTHNENTHCNGDSGGPLMCDGVQVGIVSYGPTYCIPNVRAVNTRVEYFVDWINTFIKGN